MSEKTLTYYLSLPYTIMLTPTEDGNWLAEIPDLPGCFTYGPTQEDALTMLEEAKEAWLSVALESGDPIPEPEPQLA